MELERRTLRESLFFWQRDRSVYRKLRADTGEFRVAVVRAGRTEDPVQVELQIGRIEQLVRAYETISYCWGDANDTATIQVHKQTVSVPASAAAALRCVRETDTDRPVWLDAVCINQADLDERAKQVTMMGDIYSNSKGNLVYLGEGNAFTLRAIESIYRCLEDIKNVTRDFTVVKNTPMDLRSVSQRFNGGREDCVDGEALASFFSNPWFRRVWPLQEVALAPSNTCLCGPWMLDFLDIARVARWIFHTEGRPQLLLGHEGLSCAKDMWSVTDRSLGAGWGVHNRQGWKLHHFLASAKTRHASEPRDYVYGFLGLSNKIRLSDGLSAITELQVDYRAPVEEVFRDATRSALSDPRGFSILAFISHRSLESIESGGGPSWSFHPNSLHEFEQDPSQFYHQFNANADQQGQFPLPSSVDRNVLTASGFIVEQVLGVCKALELADWNGTIREGSLKPWLDGIVAEVQEHTEGKCTLHDIAATLTAGLNAQRQRAASNDLDGFIELLEFDRFTGAPFSQLKDRDEANARWEGLEQFRRRMDIAVNRRVLLTHSASIGLGPKLTEAGDIVAVLYGSAVPLVLRPCAEEFRLVGICYFAGVMDGEAMKLHKEIGAPDVEFRIR